jgi:hypothetical protein
MTTVVEAIARLEDSIETERARTERSLKIVGLAYLILIPLVIWDVNRVLTQIRNAGDPDNVAGLAVSQVRNRMPELKQQLVQDIQTQAPQIAAQITASAHKAIPALGDLARRNIGLTVDGIMQAMNEKHVPVVIAHIKRSLGDLPRNTAQAAADPRVAQQIVDLTVDAFDRELGGVLNTTLLGELALLKGQIDQLAALPAGSLTPRQRAEKAVLVNSLYLVNHSEKGDTSLLAQGLRAALAIVVPRDMFEAMDRPLPETPR